MVNTKFQMKYLWVDRKFLWVGSANPRQYLDTLFEKIILSDCLLQKCNVDRDKNSLFYTLK